MSRRPTPEEQQAAKESLWADGELRDMLSPGQLQGLGLLRVHLFVVLCIARRWGKTWLACVWLVMVALTKPGARCLYAAPTGKMVREFAWAHMRKISQWAPPDQRPVIVGDEMRFPNGSRIIAVGCEDERKADRLRGSGADAAVIDEAGFIDCLEYVVSAVIMPQLLLHDGPLLIISTPPKTPEHPFDALADQADKEGAYMEAPLSVETAPHFTEAQIQRFVDQVPGGVGSADYQREILAKRITDPVRAIVPEFALHKATIVTEQPSGAIIDRYSIGDLGFFDFTVIALCEWDFLAGQTAIVDEYVAERTTSGDIQAGVAELEALRWPKASVWRRFVDATAITRADMVRLQSAEDPQSRWQPVRNTNPEAAVNALRMSCEKGTLRIHPRCKTIISHLERGIWNDQRTKFARSAGLGHFDGVAAAMYVVRHVDRSRNPTPPLTWNAATQWVSPQWRDQPTDTRQRAQRMAEAMGRRRERR